MSEVYISLIVSCGIYTYLFLYTILSNQISKYCRCPVNILEKAMAPHSSSLAWKIPWMEEPGRLQSMGSAKSQTQLSDFTFTFHFHALEKEMATHSSVLAWRIPGMGEPGGLFVYGVSQSRTRLKRLSSSSSSLHCWWESKLVQPLWRTVWRFLKNWK